MRLNYTYMYIYSCIIFFKVYNYNYKEKYLIILFKNL